jgi:hypothetical protein
MFMTNVPISLLSDRKKNAVQAPNSEARRNASAGRALAMSSARNGQ